MEFTIKAAYASPKCFVQRRWEKSWIVCQRKEGDPNDVYAVAVKTDATKTVRIKRRTGQIFEQSRSSKETDRNVDVSTAKVFVSTMHCTDEDLRGRNVYISICFFTAT